jgi:hypothetical protein
MVFEPEVDEEEDMLLPCEVMMNRRWCERGRTQLSSERRSILLIINLYQLRWATEDGVNGCADVGQPARAQQLAQ